ncbi:MAG: hypothetical protein LBE13_21365 [Bacteroidales bacterium]|jgi:hypothetical protein|nr:hypothetical protein [Bacteroidales bacterium]
MWNITSITAPQYSCEQSLLISFANYCGRDYQMILSDTWGFNYTYKNKTIGEKISPGYGKARFDNYESFHGIKIYDYQLQSPNELIKFVSQNIQSSPVMIDFDTYNCPWNKLYKRKHLFHRLLILDEFKNDGFFCIDHKTNDPVLLNINELENWNKRASTFCVKPIYVIENDYFNQLSNHCRHIVDSNMLNNLKNFTSDINNIQDYSSEIKDSKDALDVSLLINTQRLSNQRLCFKEYLEYLYSLNILPELDRDYIEIFTLLSSKYNILQFSFAKDIAQNKKRKKTTLLEEIFLLESSAVDKLINICESIKGR